MRDAGRIRHQIIDAWSGCGPNMLQSEEETMTKAAVVQEPPVYLDLTKSLSRAVDLIAKAASDGCGLVVFPEAWLSGYPTFVWRLAPGSAMGETDELYSCLFANAKTLAKTFSDLCRRLQKSMVLCLGIPPFAADAKLRCSHWEQVQQNGTSSRSVS